MIAATVRHPPRQARSRQSERRLLGAARALLAERGWDEITVAEIAARAGLAVGAFYARFSGKEALFAQLEGEVAADSLANVARLRALATRGASPAELLADLVASHIRLYREHAAVARALVARSHADREARERLRELSRRSYAEVTRALRRAGARPASAAARIEFALYVERSVLREAILFGEGWSKRRRFSDAEIGAETVRLLARYLGLEAEVPRSSAPRRRAPASPRSRQRPAKGVRR
jgi:AcrR family transcriptional regulator